MLKITLANSLNNRSADSVPVKKPLELKTIKLTQEPTQPKKISSITLALSTLKPHNQTQPIAQQAPAIQQPQDLILHGANQPIANEIMVFDSHGRGKTIVLDDKQLSFVQLVLSGKSCILIGAAGTGKTTCTKAAIQALIDTAIPALEDSHKHLTNGVPGIIPCAYTRRATNNLKRAMSSDIARNTITIHKLLEYSPEYYEIEDVETGRLRNTMKFAPSRTAINKLSGTIKVVIIDESSMVSTELFAELQAAVESQTIFILLGDIQQLPPVFGHAILGYKLLEWPVVELTEVYRQALDSPIIKLAHRILSGKVLDSFEIQQNWQYPNELQFIFWPKKTQSEPALLQVCRTINEAYDAGKYDPEEDIILCPFNKSFGTIEINKRIANHIARKKGFLTFEIIAGFQKYYYSIGDKVLMDKEDAIITDITVNPTYIGKAYQEPSYTLDYWGYDSEAHNKLMLNTDIDVDKLLDMAGAAENEEERVIQSSHKITMQIIDTGDYVTVSSLSELSKLDHAYAMTVHKSQGSEWRKVFLLLHHTHAAMVRRELLYTAVTRAKEQLVIVCEKDSFIKGITSQTIKGNTLAEKAEFFKGKAAERKLGQ